MNNEFKAYLNESPVFKDHILILKQDAGSSVYGFKNKKAFDDVMEKKENAIMLNNTNWRMFSCKKVQAISKILDKSDEEIDEVLKILNK